MQFRYNCDPCCFNLSRIVQNKLNQLHKETLLCKFLGQMKQAIDNVVVNSITSIRNTNNEERVHSFFVGPWNPDIYNNVFFLLRRHSFTLKHSLIIAVPAYAWLFHRSSVYKLTYRASFDRTLFLSQVKTYSYNGLCLGYCISDTRSCFQGKLGHSNNFFQLYTILCWSINARFFRGNWQLFLIT